MEAVKGYDYLICLSLETTRTQDDYRDLIENQKEHLIDKEALINDPKFPNIIEINWITYWVAEQKPEKEPNVHFVKPTNMEHLNSRTVELTGVTQEDIEHAESLESVLTKFNNFVFNSFVLKNKSYCIITFGHWELAYQLYIEMSQKKINFSKIDLSTSADLGHHFYFVFDLRKEFLKDFPSHVGSIHKIDQLLDALKLKRNVDAIKTTKVSQGLFLTSGQEGRWA